MNTMRTIALSIIASIAVTLPAAADVVCGKIITKSDGTQSLLIKQSKKSRCPRGFSLILDPSALQTAIKTTIGAGPTGATGATGPQGPTGPRGPAGVPAPLGGTIQGTYSYCQTPMPYHQILIPGTSHSAVTDENGKFKITGLEAGSYALFTNYTGVLGQKFAPLGNTFISAGSVKDFGLINLCPDEDGDGFVPGELDCDDANPTVFFGATEVCGNTIDENCDGTVNENCCPNGTVQCQTGCVDVLSDQNNCGVCSNVCPADMVCANAVCTSFN